MPALRCSLAHFQRQGLRFSGNLLHNLQYRRTYELRKKTWADEAN
jgi:hypothetical protein